MTNSKLIVYIWNSNPLTYTVITAESLQQAKDIAAKLSIFGAYIGLPDDAFEAPRGAVIEFQEQFKTVEAA